MGVAPERHREGIGRLLVKRAAAYAAAHGASFLTVKTLAHTDPHEGYARTRAFYRALGFKTLEIFPLYWDADNPCEMLVKSVC